jgi:serine/threonine-protein kinase
LSDLSQRLRSALRDRYRIERELGRGGMATVFLAEDLKHDRQVAIKVLDPEVAAAIGPERFLREVRTVARLTHPHILPLHDSGHAGGLLFYVMPYVSGESLRDRLTREKQLPVKDALQITREVALALDFAHRQGVVHRDIKPENILLQDGLALVADFGVARAIVAAAGERLTTTGIAVGTPAYMSPEQAAGSGDIDGRSDLYSLGCVLYEMLAGQPPFAGPTAASLVHQHLNVAPRPVTELRPAASEITRAAITRALAKTPADRFATAAQFAEALADPAGEHGPLASAPPWRPLGRVLVVTLAIAVILALVVASDPFGLRERLFGRHVPPRIESLAVMPLENLSRDPEQEYFADGLTEALIAELYRIRALKKVVSPTSVMLYKGTRKSTAQIAGELRVDALIEGSALREGDTVRVTVHLVHGATDTQLWAGKFDREYRNILSLYSDIASAIADEIRGKLSPADPRHERAIDPEAYQLYLKGQYYWNKFTPDDWNTGIRYFEQAIDKDPTYALAYSGLANCYGVLGVNNRPPREVFPKARAAALRALELDSTAAEPHASIAAVQMFYDWDWAAAGYHLDRAIAISPSYSGAHILKAYHSELMGRPDEAMSEILRAQELDPLALLPTLDVGIRHYFARRYDMAVEEYRRAAASTPEAVVVSYWSWLAYEQQGAYRSALTELRKISPGTGRPAAGDSLEGPLGRQAYMAALREELPRLRGLRDRRSIATADIAAIHVFLGERDLAFRWLERAYRDRDSRLPWLRLDPRFDALRKDTRFKDLLRRMNLTPANPALRPTG